MVRAGCGQSATTEMGPSWKTRDGAARSARSLVHDPQSNPRVHPELAGGAKSVAYVAAPRRKCSPRGRPIGLLHADRSTEGPGVCEVDATCSDVRRGPRCRVRAESDDGAAQAHAACRRRTPACRERVADDFTLEVMERAGPASARVEAY